MMKDELRELEQLQLEEAEALRQRFREKMKDERKRFRDVCDTEYWFCVCFTSREQKEEFLKALRINPNEKYVDGREMARAVRRALRSPDMEYPRIRGYDKEYMNRSMEE